MGKQVIISESQFRRLLETSDVYNVCYRLINNGYLVHGTNADFREFSPEFIRGGSRAREGYGAYFTDTAYKAEEYGTKIKAVKKDLFNFVELRASVEYGSELYCQLFGSDEKKKKRQEIQSKIDFLIDNNRVREALDLYDELDKLGSSIDDDYGVLYGSLRRDCLEAIETFGAKNLGSLQYNIMNPQRNLPLLANALVKLGYDGGHDDNIYTIWNFEKLNKNLENVLW